MIKILDKSNILVKEDLERVYREIIYFKKLKHLNIMKIYEVKIKLFQIIETSKFYYLIMEYASGGELLTYINDKKKLEETEASYFFVQIIDGLEYIHKNTIVQRF